MSHTAHMTRLYKCHTQPVWLDKHSAKKKEELYVSKEWHRWRPLSLTAVLMQSSSAEQQTHSHWHHCHCSHHLRWQWECHCCIQNSNMHGHATCSYHNTHWNVLMYNDISERTSYCMSDSWHNQQKSTYFDSESGLRWCTMINEFSFDSMWCVAVQTEHSHWTAQRWLLSEESECTEWAAADQQRELNQHQQLQEWGRQHMHHKGWGPCELSASRHILI